MLERVETVVIGAGVVGLAVARALALAGQQVMILEAAEALGTGISARNSEVIHAGLYNAKDSAKARLCVAGNKLLRDFLARTGVEHRMVGKLIVATDEAEEAQLAALQAKGLANGVEGLRWLSAGEARALEPALRCTAALLSPDTGILDSHGLMLALLAEAEAHDALLALKTPVVALEPAAEGGLLLRTGGDAPMTLLAQRVVNAAGLGAVPLAHQMTGLAPGSVPPFRLCKGNYFLLSGPRPFSHLVYPIPVAAGLGVHFTLDLAGQGRFGPDVEWIGAEDYRVDPRRGDAFYAAIRRYWPDLADGALRPGYAGFRPKIHASHEAARDFLIQGPAETGLAGLVNLFGVESPGLTSCLALAQEVLHLLS